MKVDVLGFANGVISGFMSTNKSKTIDSLKERAFNATLHDIDAFIDGHTLNDFDLDILHDGAQIRVEVEIGYFDEPVLDSPFIRVLKQCTRFEIHPAELTKFVFIFDGIWNSNE